jgi:hypothetical protein
MSGTVVSPIAQAMPTSEMASTSGLTFVSELLSTRDNTQALKNNHNIMSA